MATLTSSGVGSGLDVAGLVAKLVEAEGRPQSVRLNTQEAKAQAKLSAIGALRSALEGFRSALETLKDLDKFRGRSVSLSTPDFVAATASASAYPGSFTIEVQQLAQRHKLASGAFASRDEIVGTGTLTLSTGADAFSVTIDAENQTLAGIAAAINRAPDNTGIAAAVINGVDGARLVLTATESGTARAITVSQADGDGGLAALVYDGDGPPEENGLSELEAAQDARALVDGFLVESGTNTLSGAIEGVEIDLLAPNAAGETTSITIAYDKAAARQTIDKFVAAYNALLGAVETATRYDAATGTAGALSGDAAVRAVAARLRSELNSARADEGAPFALLSQIGVTSDLQGRLSVDAARLDAAFAEDFDAVGALFAASETGLAVRLDGVLAPFLETGGMLDARNTGLKATIADIGKRREALELRLAAVEERLLRQFNALDGLLAQLQSTSNFLAQQLSQLPGYTWRNQGK